MNEAHRSVLLDEVMEMLPLVPGALAIDATVGAGGHASAILDRIKPGGRLIGLDVDPSALELTEKRLRSHADRNGVELDLWRGNFSLVQDALEDLSIDAVPIGILADLGVSSMQLDCPERGFSFRFDAPLDLRMDPSIEPSAATLLMDLSEEEIADLLFHLGGERGSRRIARRIVFQRERGEPVETTSQLERLVRSALKVRGHRRIHPATRTFQALRMAVNRELDALEGFLESAPDLLAPGGVLAVISFHSGEDRLVKQRFKASAATGRFQMVRKSVIRPSAEECRANPRSRSAKLRGLMRL